jgi:GntR family transcriptional regulator/MocR family aminotransferase
VRARNGLRRAALVAALDEHVGDRVEVLGASAGLHVMLRLRDVPLIRETDVIADAERAGVRVYSPALFYCAPRQRPEAELLLGYASLSLPQIRRGIARLAGVLQGAGQQGRGRQRSLRR